jgi:hypothetical protein
MTKLSAAALAALLVVGATPAFAKEDCDAGFKDFLGKMSTHISKMSGPELGDYVRKSLGAYDSCKAGDSFSPYGVWDKILADMSAKK